MAHNQTTICNSAIVKLGELSIVSLTDQTKATDLCNLRFAFARDAVLVMHPWKWARKRTSLSNTGVTPAFEWANTFRLPTDFLKHVLISDENGCELREDEWEREGENILSNQETLYMKYVYRPTNLAFIPEYLAETIAWYLAYDIADALTQSDRKIERAQSLFRIQLSSAKTLDSREGSVRQLRSNGLLTARAHFNKARDSRFPPEAY
ncbi:hypothetical protein KAR91_73530 [Candidatus Pacearchaeota archaeon]|nr:hypothetical protein [Candidatus Pacearchaeota archaeon]